MPQITGYTFQFSGFSGHASWNGYSGFSGFSAYSPSGANTTDIQVTFPSNAVAVHIMPASQIVNITKLGENNFRFAIPSAIYTTFAGQGGDTFVIKRPSSTDVSFYFDTI